MLKKVEGIVLRAIKYSETSLICGVYTQELGFRTYIINGVRKKNSKISPALLQPMSLVELVIYHQEDKDINRIQEIKPSYVYQHVPFDVAKGAVGLFMTEVAQKTLREPEANPVLFDFLKFCYIQLDQTTEKIAHFPISFLVHFSLHLGLMPRLNNLSEGCVFDYSEGRVLAKAPRLNFHYFSPQNTILLTLISTTTLENCLLLDLNAEERRSFLSDMLKYYQYHVGNFGELNSVVVLHSVFN